ncbi:hypothetical protein ACFWCB_12745 [Streptomyces sp. NPDC060048]|uniref:hypothetical protein n=1 Tax=unclassified Streptomyces TaxID=2593676 RepID=UPI0036AEA998
MSLTARRCGAREARSAARVEPGERTGTYRLGLEDLVVDDDGRSLISTKDYAVALVDEVERDAHGGKRFTIGY